MNYLNYVNRSQRFFGAIVVLAMSFAAVPAVQAEKYEPDPNHQSVVFDVEHLSLSFVHGRFTNLTGQVNYDAKKPAESSFHLVVPAKTVDTANEKRDGHLRSKDFFDVEKHPNITFKSTKVVQGDDKDVLEVIGDLTLLGVTKSVTVEFKVKGPNKKGVMGFSTEITIKRSDYGMGYGVPNIGDTVDLNISFEALPTK